MKHKLKLKGKLQTYLQLSMLLGILLAVVDIWIYTLDIKAGVVLSGFVLFYLIMSLIMMNFNKSILMNELVSFATQYGQIQKRLLRDFEVPTALLDENGKVIWTNRTFEETVHKPKGYNRDIHSLFSCITKEKLPKENNELTELSFTYEEREFTAKMRKIPLAEMVENSDIFESEGRYEGFMVVLYLFDETALKIALRENDNQSLCVGLLYIDNYEEALESVEEVRRSLLTALIERKLNKYFAAYDGIVKKMEKDKFFVIIRKQSLKRLKENRFDLLEDVKTVNIGNDMSVTLSMGIGSDGLSYGQNYEFARTSIDLALGRGGDQVVIKTPEGVSYFGGKSQQMEKNTRVKARVKALALKEIITTKDKVLVMGHANTDVDSFGAAVGIYRIARTLERRAQIVLNDVTTSLRPMVDLFLNNPEYENDMLLTSAQALECAGPNTVLVVVDVNRPSLTECPELLKICKSIVVLDHHRAGTETIENATLSYVETYASSACEMVSEILQYTSDGIRIKSEEADSMYAGMVVDTQNFMTKTGVRTFEAAAFLRRNGADVTRVRKLFRENAAEYKAKADAVSQAEIYRNAYAISICHSEGIASPTVVGAQAANELLDIRGVKASFVLTEYQNKLFFSARSIDEVNVQVIMERMGGGGHLNIAGCQLENTSVEEGIIVLKRTLDKMIEEGEIS